ncbi:MAG: hypothetical protein AB1813_23280 [Verrucomicrobiota bacterium]|jgi:hypothetical protein
MSRWLVHCELRPIDLTFAAKAEVGRVCAWRKITPLTDAAEFAVLGAKRWFSYTREGATVASLNELRAAITQ